MGLVHCIVNPASRDYTCGKNWPKLQTLLEDVGLEIKTYMTEGVGHASSLAWDIRQQWENDGSGGESEGKPPVVVAVGGDGVAHEVASALRGSQLVLAQLPHGSGNDLCITHGIPRKDLKAAAQIIKDGTDRLCAAIRVEAKPCQAEQDFPAPKVNHWDGPVNKEGNVVRWIFLETDIGITSEISRAKLRRAKWIKGNKKYTYLGVTTIPVWKRRKIEMQVDEGKPEVCDYTLLSMTTGETFGGGYQISPGMYPTREKMKLIFAPKLSRFKMLNLMTPLKKGKHIGKWGITSQDITKLTLRPVDKKGKASDQEQVPTSYVNVDGEPCMQLPATYEWVADQILIRGANKVAWE